MVRGSSTEKKRPLVETRSMRSSTVASTAATRSAEESRRTQREPPEKRLRRSSQKAEEDEKEDDDIVLLSEDSDQEEQEEEEQEEEEQEEEEEEAPPPVKRRSTANLNGKEKEKENQKSKTTPKTKQKEKEEKEKEKEKERSTAKRSLREKRPSNPDLRDLSSSEEESSDEEDEDEKLVIEKIVNSRDESDGTKSYLVKWKNQSYLHTTWLTQKEVEAEANGKARLKRFEEKRDVDLIKPEWTQPERVLHSKMNEENVRVFLVKWKGLPYEECSWEKEEDLPDLTAVERFKNQGPLLPGAKQPRRHASSFNPDLEPPEFKGGRKLKDYQMEGFRWLVFCWLNRRNSILADEMGLGKTIQSISVLYYLFKNGIPGPFLIVAPLSTIGHWQREIEAWTELTCVVFHGSNTSRQMIADYELKQMVKNGKKGYKFAVLLTTYEMAMAESRTLSRIKWQYLILDEGHRIKNASSKLLESLKTFHPEHKLLLTGTPIQNEMKEMWTLLNYLDPKQFPSESDFLSEFGDLKDQPQVEKLHRLLDPYLLRRMKEDVDKSIPNKEETLIEIELTKFQKTYYRAILERNRHFLTLGVKSKANIPNLLNIFIEIRKLCNHPFLIKGVEESATKTLKVTDEDEALIQTSCKMVLLDKLLPKLKEGNHKVLIFSQMVRMLDIIEDYLNYREYNFERLDGAIRNSDRQAAIDRFCSADSDCFVFLLSTRAGGIGINLTAADTVIIFDSDWNPQNDLQAQARCHRIGQTNSVKIYRLVTRGTYEKQMFESASKKLGVDHVVLSRIGSSSSSNSEDSTAQLDPKDIDRLLKFGAYEIFNDKDEDDESSDLAHQNIDHILEHASTLTFRGPSVGGLSSFSKAKFITNDHAKVDVNDENFWEKVLPEYTNVKKVFASLREGTVLATEESKTKFLTDVESLVKKVGDDSYLQHEVLELLRHIQSVPQFTEVQRQQAYEWCVGLERPRLRSRNVKKQQSYFDSVEEQDQDEDYEQLDSNDQDKEGDNDDMRSPPPSGGGKGPRGKEWSKNHRDRFRTALLQFGYARWKKIKKTARLTAKTEEEIQCFAECFLQFLLWSLTGTPLVVELYRDFLGETLKPPVLEDLEYRPGDPNSKLSLVCKKPTYLPGQPLDLAVRWDVPSTAEEPDIVVELNYFATSTESHHVRTVIVKDNAISIPAPGLCGKYTATIKSPKKFKDTPAANFEVLAHPMIDERDLVETVKRLGPSWCERLKLLWDLRLIVLVFGKQCERLPVLPNNNNLKRPASWWVKGTDDRRLLAGVYELGHGRYKEIFEKDENSSYMKEMDKADVSNLKFPSSFVLSKRLESLVRAASDIIKQGPPYPSASASSSSSSLSKSSKTSSNLSLASSSALSSPTSPNRKSTSSHVSTSSSSSSSPSSAPGTGKPPMIKVKGQDGVSIMFSNQQRTNDFTWIMNHYWKLVNKNDEYSNLVMRYKDTVLNPSDTPEKLRMSENEAVHIIYASWSLKPPEVIVQEQETGVQTRYLYDHSRSLVRLMEDFGQRYRSRLGNDSFPLRFYYNGKLLDPQDTLEEVGLTSQRNIITVVSSITVKVGEYQSTLRGEEPIELRVTSKNATLFTIAQEFCSRKGLNIFDYQIINRTRFIKMEQAREIKPASLSGLDDEIILVKRVVNIAITGQDHSMNCFLISSNTPLEKLFSEYCLRKSLDRKSAWFTHSERILDGADNAVTVGLSDGSMVYASWSSSAGSKPSSTTSATGSSNGTTIGSGEVDKKKYELIVRSAAGECSFVVEGDVPIRSMKDAYCKRFGVRPSVVQFMFANRLIMELDQKVGELGVKTGDVIVAIHR